LPPFYKEHFLFYPRLPIIKINETDANKDSQMKRPAYRRRYLVEFDTHRLPHVFTDILVIGTGVAGLRGALESAKFGDVLVVTKTDLEECNTFRAQGGVAAAMNKDDSVESHIADTLAVSAELADPKVVEIVCKRARMCMEELAEMGVRFDKSNGDLDLTREGAHSHNRILHVNGDATGEGIGSPLAKEVHKNPAIQIRTDTFVIDLLTAKGMCLGALAYSEEAGKFLIWSKATLLAGGGLGQIFRETTNSQSATGDGMAIAFRAGALMKDMEMVQFHPTTLYVAGASRSLISEALRGEGAILVNCNGERFMSEYHELEELAPRDVVSRAILEEMKKTDHVCVYLDVRHMGGENFSKRFPTIYETCASFGIDVGKDLIPVRPSAHYAMGGVAVDVEGRTRISRLFACGEVACTGLHGANRLASNSLLEGLVFGQITGAVAGKESSLVKEPPMPRTLVSRIDCPRRRVDLEDLWNSIRAVMWRDVGIERDEKSLRDAVRQFDVWSGYVLRNIFEAPDGWECQNMLQIAYLVAKAALARTESRGAHFRKDYPKLDPAQKLHYVFHRTTKPKPEPAV
jgi:L-aspartate oxidase